jgi:hypothetical protein
VFADSAAGQWIRVKTDKDCAAATAYFHYGPGGGAEGRPELSAALAGCDPGQAHSAGIIRPRGGDLGTLQFLARTVDTDGKVSATGYYEIDKDMVLTRQTGQAAETSQAYLAKTAPVKGPDFTVDAASVVVTDGGKRFRLPKGPAAYGEKWVTGWPRGIREVVTERRLLNAAGTFYVLPHRSAGGVAGIKPVCTHNRRISDFCSWRGMLVIAGTKAGAKPDGHYVAGDDGKAGLWFGDVDDLWKFGKPRGRGGPWKNTAVKKGAASDPYLMTGYDKKSLALSHDADDEVTFTVEVDFIRDGTWKTYGRFAVKAGQAFTHKFPAGYSAHWVRLKASADCKATGIFTYE